MARQSKNPPPTLSLRVYFDGAHIGPGKIQLLEAINVCGSISGAGRMMNMSYRHAWKLIEDVNTIFGKATGQPGGDKGGGAQLTPFGLKVISRYRNIQKLVADTVSGDLAALQSELSAD